MIEDRHRQKHFPVTGNDHPAARGDAESLGSHLEIQMPELTLPVTSGLEDDRQRGRPQVHLRGISQKLPPHRAACFPGGLVPDGQGNGFGSGIDPGIGQRIEKGVALVVTALGEVTLARGYPRQQKYRQQEYSRDHRRRPRHH